jgi:hypothetical protein
MKPKLITAALVLLMLNGVANAENWERVTITEHSIIEIDRDTVKTVNGITSVVTSGPSLEDRLFFDCKGHVGRTASSVTGHIPAGSIGDYIATKVCPVNIPQVAITPQTEAFRKSILERNKGAGCTNTKLDDHVPLC